MKTIIQIEETDLKWIVKASQISKVGCHTSSDIRCPSEQLLRWSSIKTVAKSTHDSKAAIILQERLQISTTITKCMLKIILQDIIEIKKTYFKRIPGGPWYFEDEGHTLGLPFQREESFKVRSLLV